MLTNQSLTVGGNTFAITDTVAGLLATSGGTLTLSFTGQPEFDIVLDTFLLTSIADLADAPITVRVSW